MAGPPPEETNELLKYAAMTGSILLGLTAKVAMVWKERKLDIKTFATEAMIAIPAGMLVFEILRYTGHENAAAICGIATGRFAQDIFNLVWKIIKQFIKTSAEEIK